MAGSAYQIGLTMLARRELSTHQVRLRLARRGFDRAAIEDAVARLTLERALDDVRTAGAIARTELRLHGHGPARVLRSLHAAGIATEVAQAAAREAFADTDVDGLLHTLLDKRLSPGATIADDREMRRLFRYLVGQGFDADRVLATLKRRHRTGGDE